MPNEYVHRALAAEQHLAVAKVKIAALEAQLAERETALQTDVNYRALCWFIQQGKSAYYMSPNVFMSHCPADLQWVIATALPKPPMETP